MSFEYLVNLHDSLPKPSGASSVPSSSDNCLETYRILTGNNFRTSYAGQCCDELTRLLNIQDRMIENYKKKPSNL